MKKLLTTGPGLIIAIPTLGRPVNLDWALAFKALNPPINYNINFSIIKGQPVDAARNAFAQQAIEKDAKYLFFLGDDVIVPPHTLRQLIFRMENDNSVGVVGGVYCSKTETPSPLIFKGNGQGSYWDWKIGEYFEVTGIGMDCTIIRTDCLRKISIPLFKTCDSDNYLDGVNSAESWTEDLYFCKKVIEETDYKIMVDTSIICEHFDVYSGKTYTLPKGTLPYRQKMVNKDKKCLMLGPPIDLVDESYEVIRCTNNGDTTADYRCSFDNLPFDAGQFDWLIVSYPEQEFNTVTLQEWKRVSKGKISINCHPWLNKDSVALAIGGKVDGTFIEVSNNGVSNGSSLGS
jgi:hypothetical protein